MTSVTLSSKNCVRLGRFADRVIVIVAMQGTLASADRLTEIHASDLVMLSGMGLVFD